MCPGYALFGKAFYHEWMRNFVRCVFCIFWDDRVVFDLCKCVVLHWLICKCWTILWTWDASHLVIMCGLAYVLMGSTCLYIVENFCVCIHRRYWPVVFFFGFRLVLVSGGFRVYLGVFPPLQTLGRVWEESVWVLCLFGRICLSSWSFICRGVVCFFN